jgi:hypothetical protein
MRDGLTNGDSCDISEDAHAIYDQYRGPQRKRTLRWDRRWRDHA